MERPCARLGWLSDRRGRIQGSGTHRARRLRLSPAISAGGRRVRSARADHRPLQRLVRRAGHGSENRIPECRIRPGRRAALWLGQLSGARRRLRRFLSARTRRSQRDRNLSERLPAADRTGGHRLFRRGRRALELGRLGHGQLARVRQEQDGIHHREHAQSLARANEQDIVRLGWIRLRPGGVQLLRRARIRSGPGFTAQRRARPRSARRRLFDLRWGTGLLPQWRRAVAAVRARHRLRYAECRADPRGRLRDCIRGAGISRLPTRERSGRRSHGRRCVRRSRSKRHGEVPRVRRGARRALFGFRREPLGQAVGPLRLHQRLCTARLDPEWLPCAFAAAAVLRDDLDQLHRRRALRRHDLSRHRSDCRGARRKAAGCGGIVELFDRRSVALR